MGQVQPIPLAELPQTFRPRLLATDMDGTLTQQGQFTAALLQGLEQLQAAGLPVVIVTGRSAGWVSGLAHYLPVAGAMAENGGVYFPPGRLPELLIDLPEVAAHRHALAKVFAQLQRRWPHLQESEDNRFRLTDWTFDVQGLNPSDLEAMAEVCQAEGWGFTYSTVQCHLFTPGQSKATGLKQVLQQQFAPLTAADIVTLGDSPNDESLFERSLFPHSVGVANVADYLPRLTHRPTYITRSPEVAGFLEVVAALLGGGAS